jgi:hypothetical protein
VLARIENELYTVLCTACAPLAEHDCKCIGCAAAGEKNRKARAQVDGFGKINPARKSNAVIARARDVVLLVRLSSSVSLTCGALLYNSKTIKRGGGEGENKIKKEKNNNATSNNSSVQPPLSVLRLQHCNTYARVYVVSDYLYFLFFIQVCRRRSKCNAPRTLKTN